MLRIIAKAKPSFTPTPGPPRFDMANALFEKANLVKALCAVARQRHSFG
jgi:hypothetical protein